jgi:CTP-dependent riboflavin kinase
MPSEILQGKIATGLGKAAEFTEVPWAKAAFCDVLGVDPHPGTVNIIVSSAKDVAAWSRVKATTGIVIKPPQPDWCDAFCYKALIAGKISAAIVLPDVAAYPTNQVELIAAVNVRESLSLRDGDPVAIEIYETEAS